MSCPVWQICKYEGDCGIWLDDRWKDCKHIKEIKWAWRMRAIRAVWFMLGYCSAMALLWILHVFGVR